MGKRKLLTQLTHNELITLNSSCVGEVEIEYYVGANEEGSYYVALITQNVNENVSGTQQSAYKKVLKKLTGRDYQEIIGKVSGFLAGLSLK